ncbi:hypothetical protein BJ944DRAFT_243704, partial [Cunninghamella echinulata]
SNQKAASSNGVKKNKNTTNKNKDGTNTELAQKLIDTVYPPTKCPSCEYQGDTRSDTDQHTRKDHKGDHLFICMYKACSQGFSSRQGLQYHLCVSHTLKLINGSVTVTSWHNKGSALSKELEDGIAQQLYKHYNETVCPKCDAKFNKKTQTKLHIAESHPKEKIYSCFIEACDHEDGFASLSALVYHLSKNHSK